MAEKVLITSALPYANGPLHFGHIAGAYLPADSYARFSRLLGKDVLYISGSDEYGVAITLSAELANRSPKEHVDLFHETNKALFEKLNFSFDFFGRTTSDEHTKTTLEFFQILEKNGLISKKTEEHLYSEKEGRFLADRYVVGKCPKCGYDEARGDECPKCAASFEATDLIHPKSKLTKAPLIKKPSEHLYYRFDAFKEELASWLDKKEWKGSVLHFAKSYVKDLHERAITRDSKWGISVPGYEDKVFYVWFDAPIGYISIAKEWAKKAGNPDLWKRFWCESKTKLVHFIGKDNIPFHTVFFPAMLMGQDGKYKLPDEVPANEFFLLEGKQFSKSDGWTIDLERFFQNYTPDQIRYALAANAPENSDAQFSWKDFQMRCNSELLGKLGNFVRRVLVFVHQHGNGEVPSCTNLKDEDSSFLEEIKLLTEKAKVSYDTFSLRRASQVLMELSQAGNAYFEHKKPWILSKDPSKKEELQTVLYACLECMKNLSLISLPIIPDAAQKIWEQLGFSSRLEKASWDLVTQTPLKVGQKLAQPLILFRKIENEEIEKEVENLQSLLKPKTLEKSEKIEDLKDFISFETFQKTDIRVGKIIEAESVLKSKKLLKLQVDLGFETRTIVSGIAKQYDPENLVGKKVLVVVNLAPIKMMGIESQGMVLAAHVDDSLELPQVQNLPPGAVVS